MTTLVAALESRLPRGLAASPASFTPWERWPVRSLPAKRANAFVAKGLFVDELRLDWSPNGETAGPHLFGGMFAPRFARAWDHIPDIFGIGFAEDYDFGEHFGVGGGYAWKSGLLGRVSFRVSAYFRATEFDETALEASSRVSRSHGSARISGRPQSLSVSAFGSIAVPGASAPYQTVNWQISFLSNANEYWGSARENGVAVSLSRTTTFGKGVRLTGLIEYVRFDNFDNEAGLARHYLTGSIAVEHGKWRLSGTAIWRREHVPGSNARRYDDALVMLSVGYRPVERLEFSLGYRHARIGSSPAHMIGLFAVHEF